MKKYSFIFCIAMLMSTAFLGQANGKVRTVIISGNGSGLNIEINAGDTVRWFVRLMGVNIFSPDEKFKSSPILNNGDVYKIKFDKKGVYHYRVSSVKYGAGIIFVK